MRDDELRRILTNANPWWGAGASGGNRIAWMRNHQLLASRAKSDLGYRNTILNDVATGPVTDGLILLVGPRRVGKSVLLFDCIGALCSRTDIDSRQIIHLPCDGFTTRDLRRALTLARDLTRSIDQDSPKPRIWFFDEIGTIRGWSAVIKAARDQTVFGGDTVVATGSRWVPGEDVEGNLFAGRAGQTSGRRLRPVAPMTFRDYLTATRPELAQPEKLDLMAIQTQNTVLRLEALRYDIDFYDLAWQDFLTCGGFPRAVAEHHIAGAVSISFIRDLGASLRGDVDPDSPPESIPLLLELLATRSTSPFSIRNASAQLGYSRAELTSRMARLIGSFATLRCFHMNDNGREIQGSQSKIYLTDPLLAWLPSRMRAGCAMPDFTALTEMAIGVSLARAIDSREEGRWVSGDTIGYVKTLSGQEIDFSPILVPTPAGSLRTVPIESKWVDDGWRSESRALTGKYGSGVVATKSVLDCVGDVWAIPTPLLVLLLE